MNFVCKLFCAAACLAISTPAASAAHWEIYTAGTYALGPSSEDVAVDTAAGVVNLTLPPTHQGIKVKDVGGSASKVKPIMVYPDAGKTIDGSAGPLVLEVGREGILLEFDPQRNEWSAF